MADENNVFEGLDEENKNFIDNKGFKSVADVVNGYRNLEKLQGVPQDRLLKIPDEKADEKTINEYYMKLGRPKSADEYNFGLKDGDDDRLAKAIAPKLFAAGISNKQAVALYSALIEAKKQEAQTIENARAKQEDELKADWGNNYDNNVKLAQKAFRISGLNEKEIEALQKATDFKTVMNMFYKLSTKFSEASLKDVDGAGGGNGGNRFTYSKQEALAKLDELKSNKEWVAKFNAKDGATINEYNELTEIAYR